jgi:hypothetical protein
MAQPIGWSQALATKFSRCASLCRSLSSCASLQAGDGEGVVPLVCRDGKVTTAAEALAKAGRKTAAALAEFQFVWYLHQLLQREGITMINLCPQWRSS